MQIDVKLVTRCVDLSTFNLACVFVVNDRSLLRFRLADLDRILDNMRIFNRYVTRCYYLSKELILRLFLVSKTIYFHAMGLLKRMS
jgi:hypothetical protein